MSIIYIFRDGVLQWEQLEIHANDDKNLLFRPTACLNFALVMKSALRFHDSQLGLRSALQTNSFLRSIVDKDPLDKVLEVLQHLLSKDSFAIPDEVR
jgi:hypothetical protein